MIILITECEWWCATLAMAIDGESRSGSSGPMSAQWLPPATTENK